MAKKTESDVKRLFFDPLLLMGVIFLAITYILRGTWAGAFTESITIVIGIVWSYRAAMTNRHLGFRLLAALVMILIGSLLAIYLGRAHGLV